MRCCPALIRRRDLAAVLDGSVEGVVPLEWRQLRAALLLACSNQTIVRNTKNKDHMIFD